MTDRIGNLGKEPASKKAKVGGVELHYQEAAGMTPWSILKGLTDNDLATLLIYRSRGRLVIGHVEVRTCAQEESAAVSTPEREVDRVRKLERVVEALQRWEANPEHFWGSTPDTGSEIGAALAAALEPFGGGA